MFQCLNGAVKFADITCDCCDIVDLQKLHDTLSGSCMYVEWLTDIDTTFPREQDSFLLLLCEKNSKKEGISTDTLHDIIILMTVEGFSSEA